MKQTRRRFLQFSLAAGALSTLSGAALIPQNNQNSSERPVGFMLNTLGFSVFQDEVKKNFRVYHDQQQAFADLKAGKLGCLISSSEYLALSQPVFSLFDSIPNDMDLAKKWDWVQQNYGLIQRHYSRLGLSSEVLGLTNPIGVRLSKVNATELATWQDSTTPLRIGAQQARSLWFSSMGFDVQGGRYKDNLGSQLELLRSDRLDITEAFSPSTFMKLIEKKKASGRIQDDFYQNQNVFIDRHSRSANMVEVIYAAQPAADNALLLNQVAVLKQQMQAILLQNQEMQNEILKDLSAKYNWKVHEIPVAIQDKLQKYKGHYLRALTQQYPDFNALISSYRQYGA
ncbi:twin-arginine translocation signal domain-containing protein [Pseudobdellovibrio exovorus]|uniref:Uncharacterized protein n=1 Tax=Pseudobdellovibrio exovorus JSS TaxID=1184267 RepID=M4VU06_9BACT|nr:twin-arginine translocation signal domain-containing protein [Pseudobdellovibrio exovorus]AGH96699.1 hypothetical protein A11Q_2483 [Pseudobdellovibrio exovorus JSS]